MGYKVPQLCNAVENEILQRGKTRFSANDLTRMGKSNKELGQGSKGILGIFIYLPHNYIT